MRILAIETIGTTGSVAALNEDRLLVECQLDPTMRSARSLAPGIGQLLAEVGWRPHDVELVAVATGPGSFTGLRIGVTTAKVFAYAAGCKVVSVHTLLAVASRVPAESPRVTAVLDAGRGEMFVAQFQRDIDGRWVQDGTTHTVQWDQWLASLCPGQLVTGPGLAKIIEQLPAGVVATPEGLWSATAAEVGCLGWQLAASGLRQGCFEVQPQYFRRTAAEEQWDRREK